jgi:hypothetical protein
MKHFYLVLWVTAYTNGFVCGQSNVSSQVSLALVDKQTPIAAVGTEAIFSLNSATGEFKALIDLFPVVPNRDNKDTLAIQMHPLQISMKGRFPAGDISFLTSRENEKRYTMPCTCMIYDSIKNCAIQFNLLTYQDQPLINETGATIYQSTLNFVMAIDPHDFGLDTQPFAITKPILIIAKNAVINKAF